MKTSSTSGFPNITAFRKDVGRSFDAFFGCQSHIEVMDSTDVRVQAIAKDKSSFGFTRKSGTASRAISGSPQVIQKFSRTMLNKIRIEAEVFVRFGWSEPKDDYVPRDLPDALRYQKKMFSDRIKYASLFRIVATELFDEQHSLGDAEYDRSI